MADSFVGEIRILGFTYAPDQWALCDGQLVQVAQNQVLYSLIGNTFGGQAPTTYALPDLRGRVPVGSGSGPGLTPRPLTSAAGDPGITLTSSQLPSHNHTMTAALANGTLNGPTPSPQTYLSRQLDESVNPPTALKTFSSAVPNSELSPAMVSPFGTAGSHENRQPYLAMNFCISLWGEYPSFD